MSSPGHRTSQAPGGRWFWAGAAIGGAVMLFGIAGLIRHRAQTMPASWAEFLIGGLIIHDGLWAPIVGLASLALVRLLPAWARPTVQGALIVSIACVLVTIPALTGRGRLPTNPSILPNDYRGNLLLVLGVVWFAAALLLIVARRRPPTATDPPVPPVYPQTTGW